MKYRIEHTRRGFEVEVKSLWFWNNGYVYTDFFEIAYSTYEEAIQAVREHQERYTYIEGKDR